MHRYRNVTNNITLCIQFDCYSFHLNESGSRLNNTQTTVLSPLSHFNISLYLREMILLFLLIFASQNGIASGELTLEGLNGRLNQLETQVHDLQGEVKDRFFAFCRQIMRP